MCGITNVSMHQGETHVRFCKFQWSILREIFMKKKWEFSRFTPSWFSIFSRILAHRCPSWRDISTKKRWEFSHTTSTRLSMFLRMHAHLSPLGIDFTCVIFWRFSPPGTPPFSHAECGELYYFSPPWTPLSSHAECGEFYYFSPPWNPPFLIRQLWRILHRSVHFWTISTTGSPISR